MFFPIYVAITILLLVAIACQQSRLQPNRVLLPAVSIVLTISFFFYIIISFSSKAAFIDDYNLLDTFHRMLYSSSDSEKIKAFLEQVNEHRFPFERSLMYLIYLVFGTPDVRIQILTGNLFLLGILWLFYILFKDTGRPIAYFIPVALVLFSLTFYENASWGIAAIQNTPLIFFAMLSAYGLSRQSRGGDITGFVSAFTACFVSGSGISVWIIGALLLFAQKRYRVLLVWLIFAALVLSFYFTFDYTMYPKDRSDLLRHPFENLLFFLCFAGNIFYGDFDHGSFLRFYPDIAASVITGAFLLGICLWGFFSFYRSRSQKASTPLGFLSGALLFPLATGAMLVVSRPVSQNIIWGGEFISQRYLLFGVVLWAGVYITVLMLNKKNDRISSLAFYLFLFLGGVINLTSYYRHLPSLANHYATLELDKLYTETKGGVLLSFGKKYKEKIFWNHPTSFPNLLENLKKTGLYNPDLNFDTRLLDEIKTSKDAPVTPGWEISFTLKPSPIITDSEIKITGLPKKSMGSSLKYFVLHSEKEQYVLPAVAERAELKESLRRLTYWSDRYSYQFPAFKFPPVVFQIWIIQEDPHSDKLEVINTGAVLDLRNGVSGL